MTTDDERRQFRSYHAFMAGRIVGKQSSRHVRACFLSDAEVDKRIEADKNRITKPLWKVVGGWI